MLPNIFVIVDEAIRKLIEGCLICICILLQAVSKGVLIDWCLEILVKHFLPPRHILAYLQNVNGVDKKNKVLSRVHGALKQIADLVPLAPLRLSPLVVENLPNHYNRKITEPVSSFCILSKRADATDEFVVFHFM
jgi:hypothetical protein